jgi:S-adenosylmethionine:tRNA ribosyltransferase-isomerase
VTPAAWPREDRLDMRLLHVDPARASFMDRRVLDLPLVLLPGDLLVVNDAATLPASLSGQARGGPVEVRLAGAGASWREWTAVLFGSGTWRERTEDRPSPPVLARGDVVEFDGSLMASVEDVSDVSARLVTLRFDRDGEALWAALYRAGRPVQYSYLSRPLPLWHVQTPFGARPWAVEMPSAGRGLTSWLLRDVRRHGIAVAAITHAAGLSSTGDPGLDAILPLPERYDVPTETVEAVRRARSVGGRVVAAGTTVVRALEGCAAAHGGVLRPGQGITAIRIGAEFRPAVVDGLMTGMHEPGTSHFELMQAFAPGPLLEAAHRHATSAGYLGHEFGDACLVLRPGASSHEETS